MSSLEKDLNQVFARLQISDFSKGIISSFLYILGAVDRLTAEHSIRVGMLCGRAGEALGIDPMALFVAGTLHDVGKIAIPRQILQKPDILSEAEFEIVRKHAGLGKALLVNFDPKTAEIVGQHHQFQPCPYPETDLFPQPRLFSADVEEDVKLRAQVVALCDCYDALTTRPRYGRFVGLDLRSSFDELYRGMGSQIDLLVAAKVFRF